MRCRHVVLPDNFLLLVILKISNIALKLALKKFSVTLINKSL